MFRLVAALGFVMAAALPARAADPIVGNWRTEAGSIAAVSPCGKAFCITLRTGQHAGKRIGNFSASGGGKYSGTIVDPNNDKSYSGSGTLSGNSLRLSGCVLGVLCRSQSWTRQ